MWPVRSTSISASIAAFVRAADKLIVVDAEEVASFLYPLLNGWCSAIEYRWQHEAW